VRTVVGLHRVLLLETAEGLAIVTEAESRAACEECVRRAERWMEERIPAMVEYRPLTAVGEVISRVEGMSRVADR
jgi:dihydrodipicolinate reductase